MTEIYTPIMNMIAGKGFERDYALSLYSALSMVVNMSYSAPIDRTKMLLLNIITMRLRELKIPAINPMLRSIETTDTGIKLDLNTVITVSNILPEIINHYEHMINLQLSKQNDELTSLVLRVKKLL